MDVQKRLESSAVIPSGQSVSGPVDMSDSIAAGFIMPPAWTSAAISIEVSINGVDFSTPGFFDSSGAPAASFLAPPAGAAYSLDANAMLPWRFIRFRSGTSSSPVNQAAERVFRVISREIA